MSKIILPDEKKIVLESSYTIPDGFTKYVINIAYTDNAGVFHPEKWTLMDSHNRVNVSWLYQDAMSTGIVTGNKEPYTWLSNAGAKRERERYRNLIGYDPVNTIRGGKRTNSQTPNSGFGKRGNYQTQNSGFDNPTTQCISANGMVQTYGTYMTDRMTMQYTTWVNPAYGDYVYDVFIRNTSNGISANGLILSNDALHREDQHVNSRHGDIVNNIVNVPTNLELDNQVHYPLTHYVDSLRADFNIDVTLEGLLNYYCHIGVFYKDGMCLQGEWYSLFQPRQEYVSGSGSLFSKSVMSVNGKTVASTNITNNGHNALIQSILDNFGSIGSAE